MTHLPVSTRSLRFMPLVTGALGIACAAADDPPVPLATTRDSAGVAIVENAGAAWRPGEEWRLSAEPVLEIGTEHGEPEYEFGNAHGPVRLADGRIVVADMQTNYLSFYDASGTFLMRAGGTGQGPGEFTQLYRLRKIGGDSLMALNPASLTSIFTPDGRFVRRFRLSAVPGRGNLWWLGRLADETLLAMSLQREGTRELSPPANARPGVEYARFDVPERGEFYRDTLHHFLFTMEGELIDSIVELPGQYLAQNSVYAPNAAYAYHGDAFYHSPGDRIEIRTYRSLVGTRAAAAAPAEGARQTVRLERIVRRPPLTDLTVTEDLKDAYRSAERARWARIAERNPQFLNEARIERMLAEMRFPPAIPAHANRMYADALGNLWLQEYRIAEDAPFRWSVFDSDGQWLGVVETPAAFAVNEIGEYYVLGVARDSLDVQYVRMYTLEKPNR